MAPACKTCAGFTKAFGPLAAFLFIPHDPSGCLSCDMPAVATPQSLLSSHTQVLHCRKGKAIGLTSR
eukprot:833126-Pelagomonas_calceolata.AAC.7